MANSKEKGTRLKEEVIGIAFLALALFTAISLYSFGQPSNWGGIVGEYLSKILIFSIGRSAYSFPVLLVILSLEFLIRRGLKFRPSIPISLALFIIASSGLLTQTMKVDNAGGILGSLINRFLEQYLGSTGSFIVLGAVFLIAVIVATGLSFIQIGLKFSSLVLSIIDVFFSGLKKIFSASLDVLRKAKQRKGEIRGSAGNPAPAIIAPQPQKKKKKKEPAQEPAQEHFDFISPEGTFKLPPPGLLDEVPDKSRTLDEEVLFKNSKILTDKLKDFDINGRVVEVRPGPVVTMYEFEPAPGVKVGRITALSDDIALAMRAMSVRIIAPIPGKAVVGIEVPNHTREAIILRELIEGPTFVRSRLRLGLALGKDISGNPYVTDLARMPHILLAGATGTGKSVSVNAMILSILFKCTPEDVRFLMIDPKMLELSHYEGIPHLITPVVTEAKRATAVLKSIVIEMGKRYRLMAETGARNIERYNQMLEDGRKEGSEHTRLPYILVVIDELADLMMTSGKDVEECIMRLSQMARAAGIHLLVATQRPSVDVITGVIKTNFPARIAFQVPSRTDSRTILDSTGAETLLGDGDMLFMPPGTSKLQRIHGVYVSEGEIKRVTAFWKKQGKPSYDEDITEARERGTFYDEEDLGEEFLRRYAEAVEMATEMEMISTSYIQRRFRIGYNTAARIIEKMEKEGIVGPSQGSRPREVLKK